jgi:hypothetical protein
MLSASAGPAARISANGATEFASAAAKEATTTPDAGTRSAERLARTSEILTALTAMPRVLWCRYRRCREKVPR